MQTANAVSALRQSGLIDGPGVSALATLVRGLAAQVDAHPENAALWREFRQAWNELRKECSIHVDSDDGTDPIYSLFERLEEEEAGG